MQIHEITRRALAEAGIMGTIANKAVAGLTNKLLPGAAGDQRFVGNATATNQRQAAAGETNRALLMPLAKEMQKRWAQNVQQLLLKSVDKITHAPVTSAAQLDRGVLEKEMYIFLNAVAGMDVGKIASMDDGSGQAKQLDSELRPLITAAVANTQKPVSGANVWLPLATSIQRAKSIRQFASNQKSDSNVKPATPGRGPNGTTTFNGQAYNKNDPSHRALVALMGLNPDTYPK